MKTRFVSAAAELSVLALTAHLALLGACSGQIEPVAQEARSSKDAGSRDAAKKNDARIVDEEEDDAGEENEGDDEVIETPSQGDNGDDEEPEEDAGALDAGRDGAADAAKPADASAPASSDCPGGARPLAKGLKLRELAIYQTVKVPLYGSGAWATTRSVPVVVGKKSLLRAFVDTQSGYSAHAVRATLTLKGAAGETSLQSERTISASSTDADENSTFGFEIDPTKIAADTQLSVALEELDCAAAGGQASDARLPTTGTQALGAEAIGKLKVVVLPIDIGGRLPKTDDAELAKIRASLLAYYPVADVQVTVRATPYTGPSTLSGSDSNSWSTVLNAVLRERSNDRAASDVYYFGLMQPAATFATFCQRGCILGIAPQATRVSASSQGGLGAYFADNQSQETIVHELGHAHGRGHAPCAKGGSIMGIDGSFPEKTGGISEWGWDSRSSKLISPATYKDVMGYCSPNWISPYTYNALATRSKAVNTFALVKNSPAAASWDNVLLFADGTARWGGVRETQMPGGEIEAASVLDASGQTIDSIEVTRLPLSHSDDVILYLPTPGARWASVVLRDRVLALSDVLPAI